MGQIWRIFSILEGSHLVPWKTEPPGSPDFFFVVVKMGPLKNSVKSGDFSVIGGVDLGLGPLKVCSPI